MSAEPVLRLVVDENGEASPYDDTELARLRERVGELEGKLQESVSLLLTARRKITELRNLQEVERLKADVRPAIERTFEYWRKQTKHTRCKLTADRFDALWGIVKAAGVKAADDPELAALERRMRLAVDGCVFDPWTTTNKNGMAEVHDDITHIFRSTDSMDRYIRKSPQAAEALRRATARQRAMSVAARAGVPNPKAIGGSCLLEWRMRSVMNGTGPHWQAR